MQLMTASRVLVSHLPTHMRSLLHPLMQACLLAGLAGLAQAQGSLRNIPVPLPANLDQVVKDRFAATQLGKALFWDQQAGGDGQTACATCHYHAGVDARVTNKIGRAHV